jgi:soluble lytic murein transglycosylase-like protein
MDAELRILITATTQDIKKALGDLQSDFQNLGKALQNLNTGQTATITAGFDKMSKASNEATAAVHKHIEEHASFRESLGHTAEAFNKLFEAVRFVAGGFLGIEAIHMAKEFLDVAARTETLGIALRVVGNNAGYTNEQLEQTDRAVQKLGITAQDSRQSLATLIQSGISLDLGKPIARAAQDLAVISGLNSSQTFTRLIQNIQQLDTLGLRFMGIMVDRQAVMERAALATGRAITETAERQILANAVLSEASKLAGSYEAAMASAGKQLTSFPRYIEEFKDAVGAAGQQVFLQLVLGARDILEALTELAKAFADTQPNVELFGDSAEGLNAKLSPLAQGIKNITDSIVHFIEYLKDHKEIISQFGQIVGDVALAFAGYFAVIGGKAILSGIASMITTLGKLTGLIAITGVAAEGAAIGVGVLWRAILGPVGLALAAISVIELLFNHLGKAKDAGKEQVDSYTTQSQAIERYISLVNQRIAKEIELQDLQKQIETASFRQAVARTPDERKQADAELQALRKRRESMDKENSELIKAQQKAVKGIDDFGKVTDEQQVERIKAVDATFVAVKKSGEDAKREMQDFSEQLKKLGTDKTSFETGLAFPVIEGLNAVDSALTRIGKDGGSAASAASTLLKAMEDLGQKIKTPEELDRFVTQLNAVRDAFLSKGIDLSAPLSNLRKAIEVQVDEATRALNTGGERVRAQRLQVQRQEFQDSQVQLRALISLHQELAQRSQLIDKAMYDVGLKTLHEYYAARQLEVRQAGADELKAAEAQLREAYATLYQQTPNTPAFAQSQRRVDQALAHTQQIIEQNKTKTIQLAIQEAQQKIALYEKVAATQDALNSLTGNEEVAIRAASARAFEKELQALAPLNSAQAEYNAYLKSELELSSKLTEVKSKRIAQKYEEGKAELATQSTLANVQAGEGKLTTLENQDKQNDLIAQRIILLQQERDENQKLLDSMVDSGRYSVDSYNAVAQKINGLTKEIISARGEVQHLGAELQKTFVDSMSSNLTSILNGSKSIKQGIKDFFNDINNQILGTITKNFSESIVKSLNSAFGGQSGNFFDQIIGAITGKKPLPEKVLGSEDKPMVVQLKKTSDEPSTMLEALNAQKTVQDAILEYEKAIADNTGQLLNEVRQRAQAAGEADAAKINQGTLFNGARTPSTRPGSLPFSFKGAAPSFDSSFDTAATKYGLDAYGLNGDSLRFIAQRESNFNPDAVSPKGALGVMQVMPATAEKLGFAADQMKDAATNIDAGAKLFKMELDRYQGDVDKALAAYNAGDPSVDRAMKRATESGNPDDWKKFLPDETQKYVAALGTGGSLGRKPQPVINGPDGKPLDVRQVDSQGIEKNVETDAQREYKNRSDGDVTVPVTDASGAASGTMSLGPATGGKSAGDLFSFIGGKAIDSFMTISPYGRALASSFKMISDVKKLFEPNSTSRSLFGGGSSFTPNAEGVPRQGAYTPFEEGFPEAVTNTQAKVTESASETISKLGDTVEESFTEMSSTVSGGGLGIGDLFSSLGSTLNSLFSALSEEGGGGGGGSGGGFLSLITTAAELFAADGGYLSGPSHAGGGIAVEAEGGEFIINKRSTAQFLPLLAAINNSHGMANLRIPGSARFAYGGVVETGGARNGAPRPHVTVVQNIQTPDVNSFRRTHDQLAAEQRRAGERAFTRNS